MKGVIALLICAGLTNFYELRAVNYYLTPSGNNASAGTSYSNAWQSIDKLNGINLTGGDTVFFESGKTFEGKIYLDHDDSGSPSLPVVLTSYGSEKAVINGGSGNGFYAYNTGWIEIRNIEFTGSGPASNQSDGVYFYTDLSNGRKFGHIIIDDVYIHGFGKNGLCLGSWDSSYPGYKDITISKLRSYNNGTGLSTFDKAEWGKNKYAHQNLVIRDCEFLNCISSGMVLGGVDTGLIEYCLASNNGSTGNGVVALWAWSSRNLVFQYCIATGTATTGPDGGGYDLDGGTENCIIQYCYSGYNAGPGYMHCDYPWSRPTRNNIIRYCLSENDGRKAADNRCSYLFISWGNGLEDCHMVNNTAYITTNSNYSVYGLWGYIMEGYAEGDNPHIDHCTARNNIFYVKGEDHYLVSLDGSSNPITTSNIILQGNCYFAENTNSARWLDNQQTFHSLESWQKSTGQEMFNDSAVGFTINPDLINPGTAGMLKNPRNLTGMQAYRLESTSGIIDKGFNLKTVFGTETGTMDFFGNPYIQGNSQDIGLYETENNTGVFTHKGIPRGLIIYPNPAARGNTFTVISEEPVCELEIRSVTCQILIHNTYSGGSKINMVMTPAGTGLYLLKVKYLSGEESIEKIMIL